MDGLTFGNIKAFDNTSSETTTDATPRKVTVAWNQNGTSNRMTNDYTTGKITAIEAGTYHVSGHISFTGSANKTHFIQVYVNGSPVGIPVERKMGSIVDVGAASFCAMAVCTAGQVIEVYQWSDDGGTDTVIHQLGLMVFRLV